MTAKFLVFIFVFTSLQMSRIARASNLSPCSLSRRLRTRLAPTRLTYLAPSLGSGLFRSRRVRLQSGGWTRNVSILARYSVFEADCRGVVRFRPRSVSATEGAGCPDTLWRAKRQDEQQSPISPSPNGMFFGDIAQVCSNVEQSRYG